MVTLEEVPPVDSEAGESAQCCTGAGQGAVPSCSELGNSESLIGIPSLVCATNSQYNTSDEEDNRRKLDLPYSKIASPVLSWCREVKSLIATNTMDGPQTQRLLGQVAKEMLIHGFAGFHLLTENGNAASRSSFTGNAKIFHGEKIEITVDISSPASAQQNINENGGQSEQANSGPNAPIRSRREREENTGERKVCVGVQILCGAAGIALVVGVIWMGCEVHSLFKAGKAVLGSGRAAVDGWLANGCPPLVNSLVDSVQFRMFGSQ
ncbi:uncharacterized protein [Coffea arabica]|uniref:Uncharacterized protein isoform X2 n=1 Tax=Coffea arabica TaxID=13443 RepID=A0A6P6WYM3_COFAR|nr:uncharacterized protein LOC113736797 isoform X2 [Coffea arabica]